MPIFAREPFSKALRAAIANATGRPVGLRKAPDAAPGEENPRLPYAILYPISGGAFLGPAFAAPDEDVDVVYQVTSVGGDRNPNVVEWLADRVRRYLLERDSEGSFVSEVPAPEGWVVVDRWPEAGMPSVDPESQGLHQVPERFVFRVTPG